MTKKTNQREKRVRRHARVRARVCGTAKRPRLAVFRSNEHLYAQLIDDTAGRTLAAASDLKLKTGEPKAVGEALAQAALAAGIKKVAFDRGGYLYTGRVKALAEGARAGGLIF